MRKPKFWRTTKFKSLQNAWDEILKKTGFNDIEYNERRLRQMAVNSYRTQIQTLINAKMRYYELLGHWQHEVEFRDDVERLIMQRRSEGLKIKDISKELRTLKERSSRETIRKIIRYYEAKWGVMRKS